MTLQLRSFCYNNHWFLPLRRFWTYLHGLIDLTLGRLFHQTSIRLTLRTPVWCYIKTFSKWWSCWPKLTPDVHVTVKRRCSSNLAKCRATIYVLGTFVQVRHALLSVGKTWQKWVISMKLVQPSFLFNKQDHIFHTKTWKRPATLF